jgi:protein-disulfide isomerase
VPQHANAERAAAFVLSARALSGERAFWALHAALLSSAEADLGDDGLRALAVRLGLDSDHIWASANDARFGVVLQADRALAESVGVEGTPTLFVNGRKLAGAVPESVLEGVVREELDAARRIVKAGTPVDELEAVLCGG